MKKLLIHSKIEEKIPNCADFTPKAVENSNNAKSIGKMFFWDMMPVALKAYEQYYERLRTIYSTTQLYKV